MCVVLCSIYPLRIPFQCCDVFVCVRCAHNVGFIVHQMKISLFCSVVFFHMQQSIMMQSGLVVDRPDATLRRRRTIEEFSPLHRACHVSLPPSLSPSPFPSFVTLHSFTCPLPLLYLPFPIPPFPSLHSHIPIPLPPFSSPLQDGNVSALWDMLNGSELADLEEPSFGAIPYTPLFLTFMSDHFQVRGQGSGVKAVY